MKRQSQCLVSAKDFEIYWNNNTNVAAGGMTVEVWMPPKQYDGPERRANAHDRRFYNGQGGRRRWDRKS